MSHPMHNLDFLDAPEARVFSTNATVISRPRQSQGLLYKQPCDLLIQSVSGPFPPTALQRRHTQMVRDSSYGYIIDKVIKNFLNPEGQYNLISGSKVKFILLKGLFLHIGGVASGRVCAAGLFNE